MTLKDLKNRLELSYDSDEDNILEDFYIPALSNATSYMRMAGFFSSSAFAIAARGISKFIDNGGKMQLIANVKLSEKDWAVMKESRKKEFIECVEKKFINDLDDLENLAKDHLKMLGWMLKNKNKNN